MICRVTIDIVHPRLLRSRIWVRSSVVNVPHFEVNGPAGLVSLETSGQGLNFGAKVTLPRMGFNDERITIMPISPYLTVQRSMWMK